MRKPLQLFCSCAEGALGTKLETRAASWGGRGGRGGRTGGGGGGGLLHRQELTYCNANQEGEQVMHKITHFLPNSILYGYCILVQPIQKLAR